MIYATVSGASEFEQYCNVNLSESPEDLKLAHFDGPLSVGPQTIFWELSDSFCLMAGDEPADLRATIGTIDKKRGCWTVARKHRGKQSLFPDDTHPFVEVEFQSK